tara:strand:+ start:94 stop:945 length:852 start_codon:yes stop_codon:yes gene_type:complete
MNSYKYIYLVLISILLIDIKAYSQIFEAEIELDLRRLGEGKRILFETLSDDITNYLVNNQFSIENSDLDLYIYCRIILESISEGGNQNNINAQAIFSNGGDQYFYAKNIQFPYNRGKKIFYTTSFQPLASLLDYYVFMFIGTELDTYDYLGGTGFYNKSIEISDLGKDSDWSNGWDNRWKKAKKIKNNEYLRSMRYNFFTVKDELKKEKIDKMILKNAMDSFYEDFQTLDKKIGSDRETLYFLKTYHEEIAQYLSILEMNTALKFLILYDHDHKEIYQSYIKY